MNQKDFDNLVPSAPMETSFTPLLVMKSKALLTLAILWKRILPLSGLGNLSPARQALFTQQILPAKTTVQ